MTRPRTDHQTGYLIGPGHANAGCSCGWHGPQRDPNDPHIDGLLEDDMDWHLEEVIDAAV